MTTQKEFEDKWHYKLVKPLNHYEIPDKEYFVTCCLVEGGGAKFAIMATDYDPNKNKHWITFDLGPDEIDKLDKRFEILGDYENIDFEIAMKIVGTWRVEKGEFEGMEEGEYITVDTKNITTGATTLNNNIPLEVRLVPIQTENLVGNALYDIGWRSTTGEKLRKSFILKRDDILGLSLDQISEKMKDARSWVRGGMYHFVDFSHIENKEAKCEEAWEKEE